MLAASCAGIKIELALKLSQSGIPAIACQADVGNRDDRQRLLQTTLNEFGQIDILVNNAGITSQGRQDLLDTTEESWDMVFDTNLKGPFFLSQLVSRQMMLQDDSHPNVIVNINSVSSYAVSENRADYCIAKAGLEMMTKL